MRAKMRVEHEALSEPSAHARLKLDAGGIVDIEFVVQYLVLAHANEHPELTQWPDVIRLLETLQQCGVVARNTAETLSEAYLAYRSATHRLALAGPAPEWEESTDGEWRQQVIEQTEALLPGLQAS